MTETVVKGLIYAAVIVALLSGVAAFNRTVDAIVTSAVIIDESMAVSSEATGPDNWKYVLNSVMGLGGPYGVTDYSMSTIVLVFSTLPSLFVVVVGIWVAVWVFKSSG